MEYVVGFAFDSTQSNLMMIRKNRPDWMAGRLNGIGGKIEAGETPIQAMVRECQEEADITIENWELFHTISFENGDKLYAFVTQNNQIENAITKTDELVMIVPTEIIPQLDLVNGTMELIQTAIKHINQNECHK